MLTKCWNFYWPTQLHMNIEPRDYFIISNFPAGSLQGMRKHKLLREDILPSMASNRKVQRLLNEFMDLLTEYGIVDANQDQRNPKLPKSSSSPAATNPIDSGSLATDQEDGAPPKLNHKDSDHAVIGDQDNMQLENDQTNFPPALTNEASSDAHMTEQVNQDAQVEEEAS